MSVNVFSIKNVSNSFKKCDYLAEDLSDNSVDICFLCETFLKDTIPDSYIAINGYNILRKDREICNCSNKKCSKYHKGGGIMFYLKDTISYNILDCPEKYECLTILCHSPSVKKPAIICGIYHPPHCHYDPSVFTFYICSTINRLTNMYPDAVVLLTGDLNQLDIEPITLSTELKYSKTGATRGDAHLDKVLLSHSNYFASIDAIKTNVPTDHLAIMLQPKHRVPPKRTKSTFYHTSFSNRKAFAHIMSKLDFSFVYNSDDPNISDTFEALLQEVFHLCFPLVTVYISDKDPSWVTPYIKYLLNKKNRSKRRGQFQKCEAISNEINKLICKNANRGSKQWWNKIDNCTHRKYSNKKIIVDAFDPEEVNRKLAERCTQDYPAFKPPFLNSADSLPQISLDYVFDLLTKCKRTAPGPNNLPHWLYTQYADVLAPPLCHIWNLVIKSGCIPMSFKSANIIPLPKVKNASSVEDLRGIAVTNISARLHEKAINNLFIKPMLESAYDQYQFGFRSQLGTTDALLCFQHYIIKTLDQHMGSTVHCISIDFSKAFDSVRPDVFMNKVPAVITNSYILRWFHSFLTSRCQRLIWNDKPLDFLQTNCGCSQGTVSGPIIWNIFSNDLQISNNSFDKILKYSNPILLKYADDTNILFTCKSNNIAANTCNKLWSYVNNWAESNRIRLNKNKSFQVKFHNPNSDVCQCTNLISDIKTVSNIKLLGIYFSDNCSFCMHGDKLVKSIRQTKFVYKDIKRLKFSQKESDILYNSLTVSKILYGLSVYGADVNVINRINKLLLAHKDHQYTSTEHNAKLLLNDADNSFLTKIAKNDKHPLNTIISAQSKNPRTNQYKAPRCRTKNAQSLFAHRHTFQYH